MNQPATAACRLALALLLATPASALAFPLEGVLTAQAPRPNGAPGAPAAGAPASGEPISPSRVQQDPTEAKPRIAAPSNGEPPERQPECMWVGQRIVGLLWRDDVSTAREHARFYDRFDCPTEHLGLAFRCVIRQSERQQQADLSARIYGCWMSPEIGDGRN